MVKVCTMFQQNAANILLLHYILHMLHNILAGEVVYILYLFKFASKIPLNDLAVIRKYKQIYPLLGIQV